MGLTRRDLSSNLETRPFPAYLAAQWSYSSSMGVGEGLGGAACSHSASGGQSSPLLPTRDMGFGEH